MNIDISRKHAVAAAGPSSGPPLRASFGLALVALFGFGLAYSLTATGLGRMLFPHMATGSLIERDGVVAGSSLVAQPFVQSRFGLALGGRHPAPHGLT